MKLIPINPYLSTFIFLLFFNSFAQYGQYSQRSLLEKKIYYISKGKIGSAKFWSLPLGKFDCTLNKHFPGEGKINIETTLNFSLLSSGYIEGQGYGSRGKATAEAQFAIIQGDSIRKLELEDIDYIYNNGKMVKLKKGKHFPLILSCEINNLTMRRLKIMIWVYNKTYDELKHSKDIDMISAFSFTKEGAIRALKAPKKK